MKRLLALVVALAASPAALAAPSLLAPADPHAQLGKPGLRVIDMRDQKSYGEKHVPGAVWAAYGSFRGPSKNPGELPPLPILAKRVQSLGLTPETHAVIVSTGRDVTDFGAAARVY
jgi:thiosulfate/3-mercaptopyruvate sulfurtransferase